jgi:methylated-DNA-[protein]-cysteine S-methyltransferase
MQKTDGVVYSVIQGTWLSPVYLAMGSDGLVMIELGGSEKEFVSTVKQLAEAPVRRDREATRTSADQIRAYLKGERQTNNLPIDWSILSTFQRVVLQVTCNVPFGSVTTYGAIAQQIGKPGAARAVGQALSHNPIPLAIPCHRVLAVDGSLRGYGGAGGLKTKQALLELEGVSLR